jgi:hypothetical protein
MAHSQTQPAKRGYLANILTIPPLIYPFQYNPTQLTDSKQLKWGKRVPAQARSDVQAQGVGGLLGGTLTAAGGALGAGFSGSFSAAGDIYKNAKEVLGRNFSAADLHQFEEEGDRTLTFKFIIDGREHRPGEPERRRNEEGDILADLSILRSFVYPAIGDLLDVFSLIGGNKPLFKEPPTALLILGGSSMEGFVTNLKITETLFNSELDPVRAEVEITLIEKIDSLTFIIDSVKRLGRTFYHTAYEDIGNVLF